MANVFSNSRDKAEAAANKRYEFVGRNGGYGAKGAQKYINMYRRAKLRGSESFASFAGVTTGAQQISKEKDFYQSELALKSNEKKNTLAKTNALNGFVDNSLTMSGTGRISLTKKNAAGVEVEYSSYSSYSDFLQEYNGLQQIPYNERTNDQKQRLNKLMSEKDAVEKFMIKNESYIALTHPEKDEGNYSAIAADVIKITRTGTPDLVDKFLTKIGDGNIKVGSSILTKLTAHQPLSSSEAISLNKYIAGDLERDAQEGISDTTARERAIPKS